MAAQPAQLVEYRRSAPERMREESLLLLAGSGESILDIGARDGHYSRLLRQRFRRVVALDLARPDIPGCECIAGDVRSLSLANRSVECVLCAEVLEHVPNVEQAASEIARVAQNRILIGVPYKQDTRRGRVRCAQCGRISPPYGHVNSFDEDALVALFPGWRSTVHFVGLTTEWSTTWLASWLHDRAGNPWGTYDQHEACPCGAHYVAPAERSTGQKIAGKLAVMMDRMSDRIRGPKPLWVHALFVRNG